jgi:hypothetical protein
MKEQIYKICTPLNDGQIAVTEATEQLLDLFVAIGSALHDKVVKQIPNEYKEQVSKIIKKHYR